jgi:hypothetical protein
MFSNRASIMMRTKYDFEPNPYPEGNEYQHKLPSINRPTVTNNIRISTPNHPDSIKNENLIEHEFLNILGSTTNTLIYCLLDNSPGDEFTRLSIRESIEKHVNTLKENKEIDAQHITRIQTGKAAVNYWIDRMVENGTFDKKHTKPVKFWIKKPYNYQRNVIKHKIPKQILNDLGWLS